MLAEAPELPAHLQPEVSGACNLRCPMCLVRHAPPSAAARARGPMRTSWRSWPTLKRLTLQGLGEPLLGFNTNGVLLTHP